MTYALPFGKVLSEERHMKKPIVAIMYDFDKTLSTTDMQNYSFIPALGLKPEEFWGATGEFSKKTEVERILSYMYMMVKLSKEKGIKLTKKFLNECGKKIEYFPGVETWFRRINKYGQQHDVKVEHYLLSSGTKEIVEGCSIAKHFTKIFGCEFYFDPETQEPVWPKQSVNYTQKTQYLFRISKGATDLRDDNKINEKEKEHRIPYTNMIYLGDGMTDVPCMQVLKNNGGKSIAIYSKKDKTNIQKLVKEKRVNFAFTANYTDGSNLDKTVKSLIKQIAVDNELKRKEEETFRKLSGE